MPCRIFLKSVFSGRKREMRHAKTAGNDTTNSIGLNATLVKWRTFVWRGEKSPCENTKNSPFEGFSRGAFLRFRPEFTLIRHGTHRPPYHNRTARSRNVVILTSFTGFAHAHATPWTRMCKFLLEYLKRYCIMALNALLDPGNII